MQTSKIKTYLGFCVRARKIACGFNAIAVQKKDVYLIVMCSSASENSKKQALKLKEKFRCPLLICENELLEDIVNKDNCKVAAVMDKNLAQAILNTKEDNFKLYSGGNN